MDSLYKIKYEIKSSKQFKLKDPKYSLCVCIYYINNAVTILAMKQLCNIQPKRFEKHKLNYTTLISINVKDNSFIFNFP